MYKTLNSYPPLNSSTSTSSKEESEGYKYNSWTTSIYEKMYHPKAVRVINLKSLSFLDNLANLHQHQIASQNEVIYITISHYVTFSPKVTLVPHHKTTLKVIG